MRLRMHADARAAVDALRDDPARHGLFVSVLRAVNLIRKSPSSPDARREAWRTDDWGQVWAVPVRGHDEDRVVVWVPGGDDSVVVLYVGRAV